MVLRERTDETCRGLEPHRHRDRRPAHVGHRPVPRADARTGDCPTRAGTSSAEYSPDPWSLLGRVHWYGSYWDSEDGRNAHALGHYPAPWNYPAYAGKALADIELSFTLRSGMTLATGVQNLLNQYPDINPFGADTVGNMYGQFSPFGFNGTYYYGRLTYHWGL